MVSVGHSVSGGLMWSLILESIHAVKKEARQITGVCIPFTNRCRDWLHCKEHAREVHTFGNAVQAWRLAKVCTAFLCSNTVGWQISCNDLRYSCSRTIGRPTCGNRYNVLSLKLHVHVPFTWSWFRCLQAFPSCIQCLKVCPNYGRRQVRSAIQTSPPMQAFCL